MNRLMLFISLGLAFQAQAMHVDPVDVDPVYAEVQDVLYTQLRNVGEQDDFEVTLEPFLEETHRVLQVISADTRLTSEQRFVLFSDVVDRYLVIMRVVKDCDFYRTNKRCIDLTADITKLTEFSGHIIEQEVTTRKKREYAIDIPCEPEEIPVTELAASSSTALTIESAESSIALTSESADNLSVSSSAPAPLSETDACPRDLKKGQLARYILTILKAHTHKKPEPALASRSLAARFIAFCCTEEVLTCAAVAGVAACALRFL